MEQKDDHLGESLYYLPALIRLSLDAEDQFQAQDYIREYLECTVLSQQYPETLMAYCGTRLLRDLIENEDEIGQVQMEKRARFYRNRIANTSSYSRCLCVDPEVTYILAHAFQDLIEDGVVNWDWWVRSTQSFFQRQLQGRTDGATV